MNNNGKVIYINGATNGYMIELVSGGCRKYIYENIGDVLLTILKEFTLSEFKELQEQIHKATGCRKPFRLEDLEQAKADD